MRQIARIFLILVALTTFGTLGYHFIEDWSLFDALYMTVITLTTVGYSEVNGLHRGGRIFTMVFLATGLGTFLYGLTRVGDAMVHAQLGKWFGRRRLDNTVKQLSGHYIVCGFGRLGRRLCEELANRRLPFVVLEKDPEVVTPCNELGWLYLVADATEDRSLLDAGIERARGLATVLSSDAENLYVVLSARLLAKNLQILSRASSEKDAEKLRRAGADRVISLYATGATKMAQLLANPRVEDFFEVVNSKGRQLDLTEITVEPNAPYAGKRLAETTFREKGVVIVGIRLANGELLLLPKGNDTIAPGDCLIALGRSDAIAELIGGS